MPWTMQDVDSHKSGLTKKQKKQWVAVANSALMSCMKKGGTEKTCAVSAIKQANGVVTNEQYAIQSNQKISGYTVKETTHQEKKHLVVPVTMIVEGVLSGSNGPLLHLAEDFGKFPEAWNGIPVVINHPAINGQNVSANSPELIDSSTVGRVYNSRIENNCLKGEVWLEETKLNEVSPDTFSAIGLKQSIEVSVGVFTEYDATPGTYNGREYTAIARNHRPDHLALLPGGVGACSIADGCGIRVNSKKKGEENEMSVIIDEQQVQQYHKMRYSIRGIVDNSSGGLKEKLEELRNLVGSLDVQSTQTTPGKYHYLEEAFDTYLIYEVYEQGEEQYFKQGYQILVDGSGAAFVGDPIKVEKKIEYEAVMQANNLFIRTKTPKAKNMEKEGCTPCVKARVDALIANANSKFNEDDRAVLETLSETVLDRLVPDEPQVVTVNLSADDQAALDYGKTQLKEKRTATIASIVANTEAGIWPTEILDNMDNTMLERIEKSVKKGEQGVDFSLNGGGVMNANNASGIAPMKPNV